MGAAWAGRGIRRGGRDGATPRKGPHVPRLADALQAAELLEAAAHRIVRLLVRRRWTLADLDTLPWGVALPLRQAIQHCRASPPTDWPQAAYLLIGGWDRAGKGIAAALAVSCHCQLSAGVGVGVLCVSSWLSSALSKCAGRNDIAATMAAAEQEERPVEAAVSSIVSTPLGKMARAAGNSPTKQPPPPRGPVTPSGEEPEEQMSLLLPLPLLLPLLPSSHSNLHM